MLTQIGLLFSLFGAVQQNRHVYFISLREQVRPTALNPSPYSAPAHGLRFVKASVFGCTCDDRH